jgi:hypothetical protein
MLLAEAEAAVLALVNWMVTMVALAEAEVVLPFRHQVLLALRHRLVLLMVVLVTMAALALVQEVIVHLLQVEAAVEQVLQVLLLVVVHQGTVALVKIIRQNLAPITERVECLQEEVAEETVMKVLLVQEVMEAVETAVAQAVTELRILVVEEEPHLALLGPVMVVQVSSL